MRYTRKSISLILITCTVAVCLTGCVSKNIEAAKQIQNYLYEQEDKIKTFNNIDINNLEAHNAISIIEELTAPKYKGRMTGTKENELAVQYIASYFKEIGLESPSSLDNYLQPYSQSAFLLDSTPKLEVVEKDGSIVKTYQYPKNFIFKVLSKDTKEIKLSGYIHIVKNTSELEKLSCDKNRVLLLTKAVQGKYNTYKLMENAYLNSGALIIETDTQSENRTYSDLTVVPFTSARWIEHCIPLITADSETIADLSAEEHKNIRIECFYQNEKLYDTSNIVGYIPGCDKDLKNQYIIIGGHMDHVGDNLNGTYNPGALDNASGTAAMMEIARIISKNPIKPKKSIVFIAFNGEEYGLFGSRFYTEHPVFPLENAVVINLDMVGSSFEIPLFIECDKSHDGNLKYELLELAKLLGIEVEDEYGASSDHFYFGDNGVPAVTICHLDLLHGYHSPNDTMEDVDQERISEVMKLVLYYIDKKAY